MVALFVKMIQLVANVINHLILSVEDAKKLRVVLKDKTIVPNVTPLKNTVPPVQMDTT